MAYDPCTCNNPSALSFTFSGITQGSISLNGKFYGVSQPMPDMTYPNGDKGQGNPAVDWLSSVNTSNSSGSTVGLAGMQTYTSMAQLTADYDAQLHNYENNLAGKEDNEQVITELKTFATAVSIVAAVALRTEGGGDSSKASGITSAVLDGFQSGLDMYSAGIATPTQPTQPWVVQGEMTMSGSVQLSNSLPNAFFDIVNPGSLYSDSIKQDGTSYFPEFTATCYSPTESNCIQSATLPNFPNYNLPLGNFALLSQPIVHHRTVQTQMPQPSSYDASGDQTINGYLTYGNNYFNSTGDIYQLDASSIKYVYNPAVPVDIDKS
jgi:hypothetical protein